MEVTGAMQSAQAAARAQPVEAAKEQVARWIDEHGPAVLRLAYAILLDRAQAEDVFQDVFLKAYQHGPRLREPERIRPWLLQVTANRCRDLRRSFWWRRILPLQPDGPEGMQEPSGGGNEAVAEAVWSLPAGFRETVVLHYFEGFSTREVARLLRLSEGTVHSRLYRARKLLKEKLNTREEEA